MRLASVSGEGGPLKRFFIKIPIFLVGFSHFLVDIPFYFIIFVPKTIKLMKPNPQILSRLFTGMSRITPPTSNRKWWSVLQSLSLIFLLSQVWVTNVLADDVSVSTWAALKTAMATNNSNITLSGNITASSSDTYLEVPQNCTVTLNLNGKTINRNLSSATENGHVIKNEGTLTIHGSGIIKGGYHSTMYNGGGGIFNDRGALVIDNEVSIQNNNSTNYGGGIYNSSGGNLTISNCSITSNTANSNGGGICNNGGNLTVNGCTITNNRINNNYGGGVYHLGGNYFGNYLKISGQITINNNTLGTSTPNNLYLDGDNKIITFSGSLNSNTRIGITTSGTLPVVITSGLSGKGNASNFISDNSSRFITLNASNEAQIVSIDSWTVLKAAMAAGGNIKLAGNCTDPDKTSSSYLNVPSGKTVVLDLNGYKIDRGLKDAAAIVKGYVICNEGALTINDSRSTSSDAGITGITGGAITGGKNSNAAGGIDNSGSLTINGGSITKNESNQHGGGILNSGTLTINSGSITGNNSKMKGGGIYASSITTNIYGGSITGNTSTQDGAGLYAERNFNIQGYVTIIGNLKGEAPSNVYLTTINTMILTGNIDSRTRIGIRQNDNGTPRAITSNSNAYTIIADNFTSDNALLAVRVNDGNAYLKYTYTPSVYMNGWTYGGAATNPSVSGYLGITATYTYKAEGTSVFSNDKPIVAGTHTVKATIAETTNYIEGEATTTYTVSKATLTISEATATAEYGTQVKDIPVSATALLGQTEVAGTWAFPSGNTTVPSVSSTTAYTATFTPTTGSGNYNALTTNITPTITPKAVTVSGITASNKTYDGNTTATLVYTNASFAGKVGSDDLSVSATGQFADANVGTGKTVAISNLTLGGSSAGNYKLADSGQQTETTANISKKDVTVSGIIASNKVYDGTNTATTTSGNASFSGLVSGDALTVSTSGTFNDANVGTGKAVTISILSLGGTSADNYKLAASGHQTETTANITQKPLTITAKDQAISYGTTIATGTGQVTTDGLVDGDALTDVKLTPSTTDYTTNGKITPSAATTTNGIGNYAVTYTPGALTIGKVVLTITANDQTITYGDAPANNGVTYSGFTGTDDETVLGGTLAYDYSYAQYDDVGDDYTITPSGLTSNNYTITFANGTLTVNPKAATVTPKDGQGKTYGEDDATLTYTSTGLVNGDVFTIVGDGLHEVREFLVLAAGDRG